MASIGELKSRARECLKRYYWKAFLVCLLLGLLGGNTSAPDSGFSFNITFPSQIKETQSAVAEVGAELSEMDFAALLAVMGVFLAAFLFVWVIAILWSTFVGNIARVGGCRYFLESRDQMKSAGIGRLFFGFEGGHYKNVMKTMFLRRLFIWLWSLLLIVPGVIKAYQYAMAPYILSDEPDMGYRDVLALSKEMMQGYKMKLFLLYLSFIGWWILTICSCGIGMIFLTPYIEAAVAEFYVERRSKMWDEASVHAEDFAQTDEAV